MLESNPVRHRSRATRSRQPRQVRKEATVTGSCVCSGSPVPDFLTRGSTGAGIALLTPSSWTLGVQCLKITSLNFLPEKSTSEPTRARQDQRPRHLCPASPVDERRPRKNGRNLE